MTNPFEILEARLINIENQLAELKHLIQLHNFKEDREELLNVKQAAVMLDLAVQTIYGYVHRGEIPVSKRGKRLYFSKKALFEWVNAG